MNIFPDLEKRNYILPFSCQHLSFFFSIIIYGIVRDLSIPILTVLIGIPACAGFNTRIEGNISMRLFIMLFIAYLKEQQIYLYRYIDEWKVEE